MYYLINILYIFLFSIVRYPIQVSGTLSIDIDINAYQIPVNATILPFQIIPQSVGGIITIPSSITAYNISIIGTNNIQYNLTAKQVVSYGPLLLDLPPEAVILPGTLIVTTIPPPIYSNTDTSIIRYINVYLPAKFDNWIGHNITTAGLSTVTLQTSSIIPLSHIDDLQIYIECDPTSSSLSSSIPPNLTTSMYLIYDISSKQRSVFSFIAQGMITSDGIQFVMQSLPLSKCGYIYIFISYTNLLYAHYTGFVLPVKPFIPIKTITFFPGSLGVLWASSHNLARLALGSKYPGAVEMHKYYTNSWRPEPVTGSDLATYTMKQSIMNDQAQLILCVGGEYYDTVAYLAPQYPNVNFLITSDIRANLTAKYKQYFSNAATGHGRVYEAFYYMGFIGAATSKTGKLGIILSLDDPSTNAMVNAYGLGAKAAEVAGLTPVYTNNLTTAVIYCWTIGDFDLLWNELTATKDLINRGVDALVITTDNAFLAREYAHSRDVYTFSLYEDGRKTQGDNVLLSYLLPTEVIYSEFIQRMIEDKPIGPETWSRGLGFGVELTELSPFVPLVVQAEYLKRLTITRTRDNIEEIFCGTLIDNHGIVRLNSTNGSTYSGIPGVLGEGNHICLSHQDIYTMDWVLDNVYYPPQGVSCGDSNTQSNYKHTHCGIWVPPYQIKDEEVIIPFQMSNEFLIAVTFPPGIIISLVCIFTIFIIWFRKTRTIRFASPAFLIATNIGALLYAFSPLLLTYTSKWSNNLCLSHTWTQGVGFALLFGALFVKMYRVHRLFNNKKLKRIHMRDLDVGRLLGYVVVCEIVLLLIITYIFPPESELIRDIIPSLTTLTPEEIEQHTLPSFGVGNQFSVPTYVEFYSCGVGGVFSKRVASTEVFLSACQFCLLVWGAFLSFRTRAVSHEDLNESMYVGISIYTTVGCEVVAFILDPIMDTAPKLQYYGHVIRLGIPPIATLLLLYLPKMLTIYKQVRHNAVETVPHTPQTPQSNHEVKLTATKPTNLPNGDDNNEDSSKTEGKSGMDDGSNEQKTKSRGNIEGSTKPAMNIQVSSGMSSSTSLSPSGNNKNISTSSSSASDIPVAAIQELNHEEVTKSKNNVTITSNTNNNNNTTKKNFFRSLSGIFGIPTDESSLINMSNTTNHSNINNMSTNNTNISSRNMSKNNSYLVQRETKAVELSPGVFEGIVEQHDLRNNPHFVDSTVTIPVGDSLIFNTTQLETIQTVDQIVGLESSSDHGATTIQYYTSNEIANTTTTAKSLHEDILPPGTVNR